MTVYENEIIGEVDEGTTFSTFLFWMLLTSRPNEEKEAILDVLRIFAHFGRNRQLKQIINSTGNRLVKTPIGCWFRIRYLFRYVQFWIDGKLQ